MSFKELIDEFLINQNKNLEYFKCPICKINTKTFKEHKRINHNVWISTKNILKNRKFISSENASIYYENKKENYYFVFNKDMFIIHFNNKSLTFNYDDFEDLNTTKIFNKIKNNLLFM